MTSLKDILKKVVSFIDFINFVCIVLLISFVSFIQRTDLMHGIQTGEKFAFIYFVACIILFQSIKLIIDFINRKETTTNYFDLLLFGYFILIELNILVKDYNYFTSLNNYEFIGLLFFYIALRGLKTKHFLFLIYLLLVVGCLQSIYGLLQLYGFYPSNHSLFKMTGSFFNPGPYAGFLVVPFVLSIGLIIENKNIKQSQKLDLTSLAKE